VLCCGQTDKQTNRRTASTQSVIGWHLLTSATHHHVELYEINISTKVEVCVCGNCLLYKCCTSSLHTSIVNSSSFQRVTFLVFTSFYTFDTFSLFSSQSSKLICPIITTVTVHHSYSFPLEIQDIFSSNLTTIDPTPRPDPLGCLRGLWTAQLNFLLSFIP